MAEYCASETNDFFVTCPVCLCEFDEETKTPKFLPCSHTLCLQCLREIFRDSKFICPLCRKHCAHQGCVDDLATNSYALHILKMKAPEPVKSPNLSSTLRDYELLMNLKKELQEVKDSGRNDLTNTIAKCKEWSPYLMIVARNANFIIQEVKKIEKERIEMVLEMESQLLEDPNLQPGGLSLADVITLLGQSQPGDTLATLKEKMSQSFESVNAKIAEVKSITEKYDQQSKSHFAIQMYDPHDQPVTLLPAGRYSSIISYIAFDLLERKKIKRKVYEREFLFQIKERPLSQIRPEFTGDLVLSNIALPQQKTPRNKDAAAVFGPKSSIGLLHDSPSSSGNIQDSIIPNRVDTTVCLNSLLQRNLDLFKETLNSQVFASEDYIKLVRVIHILDLKTEEKLERVIQIILEKVVKTPLFNPTYARICLSLSKESLGSSDSTSSNPNFQLIFLRLCQQEFDAFNPVYPNRTIDQQRSLVYIRFIGELFRIGFPVVQIINQGLFRLLHGLEDEDCLERLCLLLSIVGEEKNSLENSCLTELQSILNVCFSKLQFLLLFGNISDRLKSTIQVLCDGHQSRQPK